MIDRRSSSHHIDRGSVFVVHLPKKGTHMSLTTRTDETRPPNDVDTDELEAVAYREHPEHPTFPRTTYDLSEPTLQTVPKNELIAGVVVVGLWTAFFCAGIFVPTAEFRQSLWGGKLGFFPFLGHLLLVISCYALTSILFLSCAASFLGCMTRRWYVMDHSRVEHSSVAIPAARLYLSAVLRGFFLYLITIAGFLTVTTEKSLVDTTLDQFVRMAGVTSVLSFVVGYDPKVLNRLLERVMDVAEVPQKSRRGNRRPMTENGLKPDSVQEGPVAAGLMHAKNEGRNG